MTDDLVKRLRETTHMHQVDCELKMKCADRIEELEAENKKLRLEVYHANDVADVSIDKAKELEAKLDLSEGALDIASRSWGECQPIIKELEAENAELEAKLAKAVRFLNGLDRHGAYTTDELEDLLAELTGGNDE